MHKGFLWNMFWTLIVGIVMNGTLLTGCKGAGRSAECAYTSDAIRTWVSNGDKLSEREFKMGGYACKNYWFSGRKSDNLYDTLEYYLFDSEREAKLAFEKCREEWFESVSDEGDNYVEGTEAGVCDASVDLFMYQKDNLIVTCELAVYSEWAYSEDEPAPEPVVHFERKEFVLSHF